MDCTFAFLCDYADQTGKLTAIGIGFDTIYARQVPATHPLFFAVAALRFSRVELGTKRVGVHILDADGSAIIPPLDATIEVPAPPEGYIHRIQRIALALHRVQFPKYGDYQVSWVVDGHEVTSLPLKVARPPSTGATS